MPIFWHFRGGALTEFVKVARVTRIRQENTGKQTKQAKTRENAGFPRFWRPQKTQFFLSAPNLPPGPGKSIPTPELWPRNTISGSNGTNQPHCFLIQGNQLKNQLISIRKPDEVNTRGRGEGNGTVSALTNH